MSPHFVSISYWIFLGWLKYSDNNFFTQQEVTNFVYFLLHNAVDAYYSVVYDWRSQFQRQKDLRIRYSENVFDIRPFHSIMDRPVQDMRAQKLISFFFSKSHIHTSMVVIVTYYVLDIYIFLISFQNTLSFQSFFLVRPQSLSVLTKVRFFLSLSKHLSTWFCSYPYKYTWGSSYITRIQTNKIVHGIEYLNFIW